MKKRIAVFTTSRSEFGILNPLILELHKSNFFKILLFVGGAHLSKKYGNTIKEIGMKNLITDTFSYINHDDSAYGITKSLSKATLKTSEIFKKYNFDYTLIFGDRYELISMISNSIIFQKPIFHIGGGDTSNGSIDEVIRSIASVSADLHFVASKDFAKKVSKFGVDPKKIFNVGMLGFDYIAKYNFLSQKKIFLKYKLQLNKDLVLLTLHPETSNNKINYKKAIYNIFSSLKKIDIQLICTSPNNEVGSNEIQKHLITQIKKNKNYFYYKSLGMTNYHNLLKYSKFIIGNSSSGIMESPFFKIPSINLGNRQSGRLRHNNIIDSSFDVIDIDKSLRKLNSSRFKINLKKMKYKLGSFNTSIRIRKILEKQVKLKRI